MTNIILQAHSGWRWIVLLVLAITTVKLLIGWLTRQKWTGLDTRLVLLTRVAIYIQVVLGVVLYILRQHWNNMQFTGEHVVVALLAVGAVEFGAARAKKSRGAKMFTYGFIGLGLGLVLLYLALQIVGGIFT